MPKWVSVLLLILLVASLVVSSYLLAHYYMDSRAEQNQFDALAQLKDEAAAGPTDSSGGSSTGAESEGGLSWYGTLAASNHDMVGWITIPGTIVDYPVMQTPADPQYYLSRDFYGKRSSSGSIFMDGRCEPALSHNRIIYGHNMKSGTMFGVLSEYRGADFAREHRIINFDTLYEQRQYEVIAIFTTGVSGFASEKTIYDFVDLSSPADFAAFAAVVQSHLDAGESLSSAGSPDYLTLSTCTGNSDTKRFVVVAQRVRD